MRLTDIANTEELLRIIQSIPSPKAEPFKLWLAQTGADHLMNLKDAQRLREELDIRMQARDDVKKHNKLLAKAAQNTGVALQNSKIAAIWGYTMARQLLPSSAGKI